MQVKLKDVVAEFIVPMRDKPKKFDGDIPWCRIEDIQGKYLHGTLSNQFVSSETIKEMNLRVCPKNTILCTCSASIGIVAITTTELCTNQTFIGLVPSEKLNPEYLYYYLKLCQKKLEKLASITTIPYISRDDFKNLVIDIPERSKQDELVRILSLLDAKIENNRTLINELESLARLLYQYWFLQFEFPNEEGKPYKSCGCKMVWSEELKREIPEKFVVENIRTKCDIIDCLHSKKPEYHYDKDEYYLLELENLTESGYIDLGTKYYISEDDYRKWTKNIEISENDFVITNAGRTGAIGKIPKGITCALGRNFTAIRPRDINPIYLREYFKSNYFLEQMLGNLDLGSFFKSFNVKSIKQLNILIPEKYVLSQFTEIVAPMISKIENNILENIELSALRDFLLPLLMNGQVTFKDEKECPA